jgi:mono/diheme cytochrome c family protein
MQRFNPRRIAAFGAPMFGAAVIWFANHGTAATAAVSQVPAGPETRARSEAAFRKIAAVLRDPRCMNCHTVTDFPRQGDDRHRHIMDVLRGQDGHGVPGQRCSTCHMDANQVNGVPGAPKWGLAPLSMGWEGLDDHQLADAIKDAGRNGHRTLAQIQDHMAHDALVSWAWNPGAGRRPPEISQAELGRLVQEWIDTGAVSPNPRQPAGILEAP